MAPIVTLQTQPLLFTAPDLLEVSPADLRDAWDECATIMECDGGLARSVAEHAAWRWLTAAAPP